jgi:integrase
VRHAYATDMANKGMELPELARLLGHSDVSMSYRYYTPDVINSLLLALGATRVPDMIKKVLRADPARGHRPCEVEFQPFSAT